MHPLLNIYSSDAINIQSAYSECYEKTKLEKVRKAEERIYTTHILVR